MKTASPPEASKKRSAITLERGKMYLGEPNNPPYFSLWSPFQALSGTEREAKKLDRGQPM